MAPDSWEGTGHQDVLVGPLSSTGVGQPRWRQSSGVQGAGYPPGTMWMRWWHVGGPTQAGKQRMSEVTGERRRSRWTEQQVQRPWGTRRWAGSSGTQESGCHQKPRPASFLTATPTMATQPCSAHSTSAPTFCAHPWQTSGVNDHPPPHRPQLQPQVPWQGIRNLLTTPGPTPLPSQLPPDFGLNLTVRPRKVRNKGDGSLPITSPPRGDADPGGPGEGLIGHCVSVNPTCTPNSTTCRDMRGARRAGAENGEPPQPPPGVWADARRLTLGKNQKKIGRARVVPQRAS